MKIALSAGWEVGLYVDDDGHLTVAIENADESPVLKTGSDIADNEYEWCDRFTTEKIEREFTIVYRFEKTGEE